MLSNPQPDVTLPLIFTQKFVNILMLFLSEGRGNDWNKNSHGDWYYKEI